MTELANLVTGSGHDYLSYQERTDAVKRFGFGVITDKIVEVIRRYEPILEVGAGAGYWSHVLREGGVDVVATDANRPGKSYRGEWADNVWTDIELIDANGAVRKYPDRTLLMVWPCYSQGWANQCLKRYRGQHLLFCGEDWGGCTADKHFWIRIQRGWKEVEQVWAPQWNGLHDYFRVYEREAELGPPPSDTYWW